MGREYMTLSTEHLLRARGLLSADHPDRGALRTRALDDKLALASRLPRRCAGRGESLDDLTQVAALALIQCRRPLRPGSDEPVHHLRRPDDRRCSQAPLPGQVLGHAGTAVHSRTAAEPVGRHGSAHATPRPALDFLIAALPLRERHVLTMRIHGEMTQASIAAEFGISQMQVSRLQRRALTPAPGRSPGLGRCQGGRTPLRRAHPLGPARFE
jgi:DNA-directed RNA polymerase specialized sigma24 family protein